MDSPRSYHFYVENDEYILYNISSSAKQNPLLIDRVMNTVSISNHDISYYESTMRNPKKIFGILGTVRLISGRFLMTVDECLLVGHLFGHQIFKVTSASLHPFAKSRNHLSITETEAEVAYISMLNFMLQMEGMYFSNTYDLTASLQRVSKLGPEDRHMNLFERAEKQFLWNNFQLQDWSKLLHQVAGSGAASFDISNYLTPIILGFVGIDKAFNSPNSAGSVASYAIISRRSVEHAGTRFFARGLESNAKPANFVETEQLVYLPPSYVYSFVQVRGSVPLFWNQSPTLRYHPKIKIGPPGSNILPPNPDYEPQSLADVALDQRMVIQRHFHDICSFYDNGKVVAVNLMDQTGMERPLSRMYTLASQAVDQQNLKYVAFDFHKECRSLRWDRLKILISRLEPELHSMGQLKLLAPSGRESLQDATVVNRQRGMFRINCTDCLDRTNVLQSMLARRALFAALLDAGIATASAEDAELWPGFTTTFNELWADHADVISLQYSGTPALKTDFTRTGKRTFKGALMDGYNSLLRYYLNNFVDGFRQDAFSLFLGRYNIFNEVDGRLKLPLPKGPAPSDVQSIRRRFLPFFFAFSTSMSALCFLFPSVGLTHRLMYFLFWGLASVLSATVIFVYGKEFVDKPRFPRW